ncbi:hypothetical protein [Pseudanabaena sp. 'Roaring Creek']|uniref:hypothetical protein n=1 Tax=Pseudanabaena sp. 'Roaring Creek' TaxID=1681830 RepID=UPI0006D8316E|nr:hypothetical protein [Pseudanabaena sp. 'Roaring Creek']
MSRQDFRQKHRHNWLFRWSGRLIKYFCLLVLGFGLVTLMAIALDFFPAITFVLPIICPIARFAATFLLFLGAIATIIEGLR